MNMVCYECGLLLMCSVMNVSIMNRFVMRTSVMIYSVMNGSAINVFFYEHGLL